MLRVVWLVQEFWIDPRQKRKRKVWFHRCRFRWVEDRQPSLFELVNLELEWHRRRSCRNRWRRRMISTKLSCEEIFNFLIFLNSWQFLFISYRYFPKKLSAMIAPKMGKKYTKLVKTWKRTTAVSSLYFKMIVMYSTRMAENIKFWSVSWKLPKWSAKIFLFNLTTLGVSTLTEILNKMNAPKVINCN